MPLRKFANKVLTHTKSIPIMALVDGDPYGLDILSVYKYGSRALKHENERLAAGDRVVWIGIWASEFSRCV